jgi:hypothetical protein
VAYVSLDALKARQPSGRGRTLPAHVPSLPQLLPAAAPAACVAPRSRASLAPCGGGNPLNHELDREVMHGRLQESIAQSGSQWRRRHRVVSGRIASKLQRIDPAGGECHPTPSLPVKGYIGVQRGSFARDQRNQQRGNRGGRWRGNRGGR